MDSVNGVIDRFNDGRVSCQLDLYLDILLGHINQNFRESYCQKHKDYVNTCTPPTLIVTPATVPSASALIALGFKNRKVISAGTVGARYTSKN